jgi:hypothetical protein
MPVGSELKAFASKVFAPLVVFDAGDVSQTELAVLVIAFELRLLRCVPTMRRICPCTRKPCSICPAGSNTDSAGMVACKGLWRLGLRGGHFLTF